jgi:hypothetical protein
MANTTDSGLGEALASYQPKVLPAQVWGRFSDDAVGLVVQLNNPTKHRAIQRLSRLAVFLADVAPARPEARLADLLCREQIDGFLARQRSAGKASGTVDNYRAALNAFLAVAEGRSHRQPTRRKTEPTLQPYSEGELIRLLAAAAADGSEGAVDLARTLGCVLAGGLLPTDDATRHIEVADGVVQVGDLCWTAPVGLPLPSAGALDAVAVDRGRRWAREQRSQSLDARRLDLTALTAMAATCPATRLLELVDVGRDRLKAAAQAATRPQPAAVATWLRGT